MSDPRIVALVGRPNVGKSRLFNRLARRRISIVHDQPGVTRDVITTDVQDGYTLMDTGGLGLVTEGDATTISELVETQVHLAVEAASLIFFVVDGREGLAPLDELVADHLRRSGKPVVLIVNKLDNPGQEERVPEFKRLGFREWAPISAEHGRGEDRVREIILEKLGPAPEKEEGEKRIRICFVGRPNVGKSSLSNRLLKADRLIVTDIPGTTRDAVELDLDYQTPDGTIWPFRLIDTAGVRQRTKVSSSVEFFSATRSEAAIEGSDVVFLVVDAKGGVTKQEQNLAGMVLEKGRALVIVVNKWDLARESFEDGRLVEGYATERDFREAFAAAVRKELFFSPDSAVLFVSAKEGYAVDRILKAARRVNYVLDKKLPTARLNKRLIELAAKKAPPSGRGTRFRIYYAVQTGNRPFRIKLFCNEARKLPDTYRRYLEAGISSEFDLGGCPIRFELVGKPKRVWKK